MFPTTRLRNTGGHHATEKIVRPPQSGHARKSSAFLAVDDLIDHVQACRPSKIVTPLFVHGPAGTGKSHLVSELVRKVTLPCTT